MFKGKEKLMKHLDKKGSKKLDPMEKDAKMGVIKELGRQAGAMMGDKVHPKMKAMVAADNPHDLKEGLDKAAGIVGDATGMHEHDPEKLLEQTEEEMHADLDKDGEAGEPEMHKMAVLGRHPETLNGNHAPSVDMDGDEMEAEHADHSPEEIDAKIAKLHEIRAKKLSRA
jgi:hypothetical protein